MNDDPLKVAQSGDDDALTKLYARVFGFVRSKTGNSHDAADACQETFKEAWKHISDLKDPNRLQGWLFTIASHTIQRIGPKRRGTSGSIENANEIEDSRDKNLEADIVEASSENRNLVHQLFDEFNETRTKRGVVEWGPFPRKATHEWLKHIVGDPDTYKGVAEQTITRSPSRRSRRLSSPHRKRWYLRCQFVRICDELRGIWSMFPRFCRRESLLLPFNKGDGDELLGYQAAREEKAGINPPTFVTQAELWPKAITLVNQRNELARRLHGQERFVGKQYSIAIVRAYCRALGGGITWGAVR